MISQELNRTNLTTKKGTLGADSKNVEKRVTILRIYRFDSLLNILSTDSHSLVLCVNMQTQNTSNYSLTALADSKLQQEL